MEGLVKGDVVVIPFPFSDLTASKKRPAIIVASLTGDDQIVAQITSVARNDSYSISPEAKDFKNGKLPHSSMIRPNKLFTADKSLISYKAGSINDEKIKEIEKTLVSIFTK
ncbi:MAG TPA: type II toxin-antitoxin system PemK/MazF family toxin [Candidatus Nanoarchaeia archaeon]|nr:type II toxin-antitoxin system PemK/MazF family toxin [Candidatus Nanoarchaeia archaeon]